MVDEILLTPVNKNGGREGVVIHQCLKLQPKMTFANKVTLVTGMDTVSKILYVIHMITAVLTFTTLHYNDVFKTFHTTDKACKECTNTDSFNINKIKRDKWSYFTLNLCVCVILS